MYAKFLRLSVAALMLALVAAPAFRAEEKAAGARTSSTRPSGGQFKKLVAAVKAAGLVETLKGEGPFTVFAPTDKAFAELARRSSPPC